MMLGAMGRQCAHARAIPGCRRGRALQREPEGAPSRSPVMLPSAYELLNSPPEQVELRVPAWQGAGSARLTGEAAEATQRPAARPEAGRRLDARSLRAVQRQLCSAAAVRKARPPLQLVYSAAQHAGAPEASITATGSELEGMSMVPSVTLAQVAAGLAGSSAGPMATAWGGRAARRVQSGCAGGGGGRDRAGTAGLQTPCTLAPPASLQRAHPGGAWRGSRPPTAGRLREPECECVALCVWRAGRQELKPQGSAKSEQDVRQGVFKLVGPSGSGAEVERRRLAEDRRPHTSLPLP